MSKITINTDGGSRGNPGPAAVGVVITWNDTENEKDHKVIGVATNNQAEYQALLHACHLLKGKVKKGNELEFILDSELVVKQMRGEYKVKDKNLADLKKTIDKMLESFAVKITFTHVKREKNKEADKLVNKALDNA